jgi:hypothetical protein|tara:strand:+ start:464 stop:643 length:180 start_codon:yes stop_codon:yes gene_type:complete
MKKSIRLEVAIGLISIDLIAQVVDVPFKQASSVKYTLSDKLKGTELKKVVVDYNEIVMY